MLDRVAYRRGDPDWLADAWNRARVIVVDVTSPFTGHALVGDGGLVLLDASEGEACGPEESARFFLGVDRQEVPYFAMVGRLPEIAGTRAVTLREIGHVLDERDAGILATALGLVNWHARHGYSPVTGLPTVVGDGGWSRVDDDGGQYWPRTDPAVIMLVHDGVPGSAGRCLLGHNAAWAPRPGQLRRYSCLAGFVEPGESAEAAVEREVFEEVGVRVTGIGYVASQPWPYPGSLMLGFTAIGNPDAPLRLDPAEIAAARWFTRAEINASLAAGPDALTAEPGLPSASSIAYRLVHGWASAG